MNRVLILSIMHNNGWKVNVAKLGHNEKIFWQVVT